MKRVLTVLLFSLLCLVLSSCAAPLTAQCEEEGRTVTVTYNGPTNIAYSETQKNNLCFHNGYAVVYVHHDPVIGSHVHGETAPEKCGFNAMDTEGNLIFDKPFYNLSDFNAEGWAAAQPWPFEPVRYIRVNADGREEEIDRQTYESYWEQPVHNYNFNEPFTPPEYLNPDEPKNILSMGLTSWERRTKRYGVIWEVIAPLWVYAPEQQGENDHLLGFIDADGNTVIEPFIPVKDSMNYIEEGYLVINDNGMIGIVHLEIK